MPKKEYTVTTGSVNISEDEAGVRKFELIPPKLELHIALSLDEIEVLKTVLDRDRTSKQVHGGLGSLLTLTGDQAAVLLNFLRRI